MSLASTQPNRIVPVIMCGGAGTRLWPMSTAAAPKQFHPLHGPHSMLTDTLERVRPDASGVFLDPVIICSDAHTPQVEAACKAAGVTPSAIVLEPFGRNTAAVAQVAASVVNQVAPGALALLLPADHIITLPGEFRRVVLMAAAATDQDIVTFGIQPDGPETGYGYIQQSDAIADGVFRVKRFAEKPDRDTATAYLAQGGYSWNAGIFLFPPALMREEMGRHAPDVVAACDRALAAADRSGVVIHLDREAFGLCPSVAVDVAVMENTSRACVAPCAIGWTDIGSWNELLKMGPHDADGNRITGDASLIDTSNTLVWAHGVTVTALGVEGLVIVATPEAVMVIPADRAQDVKRIVEAMKSRS